jgi:hypothetical protein
LFSLVRNPLLDSLLKLPPRQHHPAITAEAAKANIGANAVDLPAITATWVPFAHLDNIANLDICGHDCLTFSTLQAGL